MCFNVSKIRLTNWRFPYKRTEARGKNVLKQGETQQEKAKITQIELFVWFPIKIETIVCVCVCVLKWARFFLAISVENDRILTAHLNKTISFEWIQFFFIVDFFLFGVCFCILAEAKQKPKMFVTVIKFDWKPAEQKNTERICNNEFKKICNLLTNQLAASNDKIHHNFHHIFTIVVYLLEYSKHFSCSAYFIRYNWESSSWYEGVF